MTIRNLDQLLAPKSVAMIGASRKEGSVGLITARNILRGGFAGPVWLVNPKYRDIEGHPCHPSIGALPDAPHLAVVATLEMALAILLEAALSFLGLGVPPPLPSWGLMIAEGKDYMFFSAWVIMIPGAALAVLVLGINLVGDGLRNLLGAERLR